MSKSWTKAGSLLLGSLALAMAALPQGAFAADSNLPDQVNRKILRVCSSPENLPYSNEKGEGFENKIAEIIADELKVPIEYTWFPLGIGLARKTLAAKKCERDSYFPFARASATVPPVAAAPTELFLFLPCQS